MADERLPIILFGILQKKKSYHGVKKRWRDVIIYLIHVELVLVTTGITTGINLLKLCNAQVILIIKVEIEEYINVANQVMSKSL